MAGSGESRAESRVSQVRVGSCAFRLIGTFFVSKVNRRIVRRSYDPLTADAPPSVSGATSRDTVSLKNSDFCSFLFIYFGATKFDGGGARHRSRGRANLVAT